MVLEKIALQIDLEPGLKLLELYILFFFSETVGCIAIEKL